MQNIKETSDTLRGPKVNARKHWDGESWILADGSLPALAEAVPQTPLQARGTSPPVRRTPYG